MRRYLATLIEMLSALDGLDDLSLTTNGLLLEQHAASLANAGLRRVNVSLDTLDPERFEHLTRRRQLDRVLRGLDRAVACGLTPVKINTVLVREVNDHEALELVLKPYLDAKFYRAVVSSTRKMQSF